MGAENAATSAPAMLVITVVLVLAAVLFWLLTTVLDRRRMTTRLRLALGGEGRRVADVAIGEELRGGIGRFLGRLSRLMPLGDEDRAKIKLSLRRAAHDNEQTLSLVLGAKVACILLGLAVGLFTGPAFLEGPLGWLAGIGGGFLFGILINTLPELVVTRMGVRRLRRVDSGLVDAFDLMIICLESGLTFERALRRTVDNLTFLWPDLARELRSAVVDMAVHGRTRVDALTRVGDRLDSQPLKDLAMTVGQSERFGTPLADALRKFVGSLRVARVTRMQEKAARLPTLLVVPSIVGLLPGILVIVGGPAFVQLAESLGSFGGL